MNIAPFLKVNGNLAEQEHANVAILTMLYAPMLAGCCSCSLPIRLGRNADESKCPACGKVMEMHPVPGWAEDMELLFEAGYLVV
ncbi:MAG: hypothetical protein GY832_37585 [Chloroflexi bacterium]|nr:hypothetical protein [Chloroflexota bacterium]